MTLEHEPGLGALPQYREMLDLRDRVYVVIGAGQGIGYQCCVALAECGATVVAVDNDRDRAHAVAAAVGGTATVADVRKAESVEGLLDDAVRVHGALHGVVNIVGLASSGSVASTTETAWDAQFDIVLRHTFHTLRFAPAHIAKAGGGTVVLIGSLAGLIGVPGQAVYGAAKAALHQLVRSTALEVAPSGVRINAVAPGITQTPRLLERLSPEAWGRLADANPNKRVGLPSDIAAAVLFLSSPMARHVTGQVLSVDGGLSAHVGRPPMAQLLADQ